MTERDIDAIASWTAMPPDPAEGGHGQPYVCRECAWRDRGGMLAFAHHRATGHAVRGKSWPDDWPDAVFGGK